LELKVLVDGFLTEWYSRGVSNAEHECPEAVTPPVPAPEPEPIEEEEVQEAEVEE
jgi:hypothetical protein